MRIAHVANFYGPTSGGLRTAIHALGSGYSQRGHEFLMIVPGVVDSDKQTEFGRRVTVRAPVIPFTGGYRVILRIRRVRAVLTQFDPHRLEVSDRTTLHGLGGWAAKRGLRSTFFSHERADGILRANIPRWLHVTVPITWLVNVHNRGTAKRFSTVVCTTGYAAVEFDRLHLPSARVPLGVDLEAFNPERFDARVRERYAAEGEALVVMASRLSKEKRPGLAIEAVRKLADEGVAIRLVSAGTGAIARQVESDARGAPVTFLGFVDGRGDYAALLASADVLVAPGPIETFGLAALEALASGTPAVVNSQSALPEVVGDAGAIAAPSAAGFTAGLREVLARDPVERRAAARTRAEQFPWSATVERMLAIYGSDDHRPGE